MRSLFFLFSLILIFSSYNALAFDCSSIPENKQNDCLALSAINESWNANIIYSNYSEPDHSFIAEHNRQITAISKPRATPTQSSGVIHDAWIDIISVEPSVLYHDLLYVQNNVAIRSAHNYSVQIPNDYYNANQQNGQVCRRIYSLADISEQQQFYANENEVAETISPQVYLDQDSNLSSKIDISVTTREDEYRWNRYCCRTGSSGCRRWCYSCDYSQTNNYIDSVSLQKNLQVFLYSEPASANVTIIRESFGSEYATVEYENSSNIEVQTDSSYFSYSPYYYDTFFSKEPLQIVQLRAHDQPRRTYQTSYLSNNSLVFPATDNCAVTTKSFFQKNTRVCDYDIVPSENVHGSVVYTQNWILLLRILVFLGVLWVSYKILISKYKKFAITTGLLLFLVPFVQADDCGLSNLGSCLPESIFDYLFDLVNQGLQPLLDTVKRLLDTPPQIEMFHHFWQLMVYGLSLMFGVLFLYSGILFLISGHDPVKRDHAKEWLRNTVLMIIFVQASYYLYEIFLELGTVFSGTLLNITNPNFFLLTADHLVNVILQFLFGIIYLVVLLITILFLVLRYAFVSFGIVFVPLGLFCYFLPPLRSYGRLILQSLGVFIFITVLDSVIILGSSKLLEIALFANLKIIVMIVCFLMIDLLFILATLQIIMTSGLGNVATKVVQAVTYVKGE